MTTAWHVVQWVALVAFTIQFVFLAWFALEAWRAPLVDDPVEVALERTRLRLGRCDEELETARVQIADVQSALSQERHVGAAAVLDRIARIVGYYRSSTGRSSW